MTAPEQQERWFNREVRPWLAATPASHRILTWGNHDWCGQACDFSGDAPGRASTTTLQILVDDGTSVPQIRAGQPDKLLSVWATPWSNQFLRWAFMKKPAALAEVYASIPVGIDILVSHQPPFGYGDLVPGRTRSLGQSGAPRGYRTRPPAAGHLRPHSWRAWAVRT